MNKKRSKRIQKEAERETERTTQRRERGARDRKRETIDRKERTKIACTKSHDPPTKKRKRDMSQVLKFQKNLPLAKKGE